MIASDSFGSNPPSWRPGDKVTVLYRADNPGGDVMIDRGMRNWLLPGLFIAAAAPLGWPGLWMRRGARSANTANLTATTVAR